MKPRFDPRVFLALTLSRTVQARMADIQSELTQYLANWHFIPQANFHVTLRFFGELPEDTILEVDEASRRIAPQINTFSLHWNRLAFFGPPSSARVIFLGAEECEELDKLSHALGRALPNEDEQRRFHPHVTLAKARKKMEPHLGRMNANMLRRLRDLGRIGPEQVNVDLTTIHREFVLMETVWVGRGVEYEIRQRYALGAM